MDQAETEECLRKAFTSDPPPTGDQLVKICGDIDTRQEIRDVFSGRRWWELAPDLVMEHDDAISFLEPEGLRHYLPANPPRGSACHGGCGPLKSAENPGTWG